MGRQLPKRWLEFKMVSYNLTYTVISISRTYNHGLHFTFSQFLAHYICRSWWKGLSNTRAKAGRAKSCHLWSFLLTPQDHLLHGTLVLQEIRRPQSSLEKGKKYLALTTVKVHPEILLLLAIGGRSSINYVTSPSRIFWPSLPPSIYY